VEGYKRADGKASNGCPSWLLKTSGPIAHKIHRQITMNHHRNYTDHHLNSAHNIPGTAGFCFSSQQPTSKDNARPGTAAAWKK